MLFTQKSPCIECPFRTTAMRGWLGGDTAQVVLKRVHSEEFYPCHMSVTENLDEEDGIANEEEVQHCVGALMHANKSTKRFRTKEAIAAQERLRKNRTPVLGYMEFLKHHTL